MKQTKRPSSKTRQLTLAAVFSAIYVTLRVVPTFSMIGVSGQFTAGDFILTSIAAIAGLWSGTLAVLVGTIVAYPVRPPIFFSLDFLPAVVNVSLAALLLSGRRLLARGIYVVVLVVFLVSPYSLLYGYDHVPYVWLHLVALAILLSPVATRIASWISGGGYRRIGGFASLAFIGTMAQHLAGGLLYELAFGYVGGVAPAKFAENFAIIFFLYPEERLLVVAISTILAVALFRAFQRWRPQSWRD